MGFGWIVIACACAALVALLILVAPIRVELEYRRSGTDEIQASVRALYGLVRLRWTGSPSEMKRRPRRRRDERSRQSEDSVDAAPRRARSLRAWRVFMQRAMHVLDRMARHVHVDELRLEARMGAGESVRTGMLVGMSYALIYTLLGWLTSRVRMHRVPTVSIAPAFQEALLTVYAKSIVRIRTGHVIAAGLRLLTAWKRRAS
ncbi:Protein of unknown function [Alicyclobacillus vulcanalis]|uniref:DUF2953 domain-containing protein n=2 Tax=Alicyclobacillus vulcanalis TaxID=252246 RepID=A0A1N7KL69_9BACL|nr:Protein of unknown function [Alicyclobacillus vulcanalis]